MTTVQQPAMTAKLMKYIDSSFSLSGPATAVQNVNRDFRGNDMTLKEP